MKRTLGKKLIDYVVIALGCFLFALSFNLFLKHAQIAVGGITGIAMVINYFFPQISMGVLTFVINIPFLIIGLRHIGGEFMAKTVFASFMLSLSLQITEWVPSITDDPLLCSIYGGIGVGVGIGFAFLRNGSTGGSDIIGLVLKKRYSGISVGTLVLIADTIIVLCASFAFKNVNSVLYAIIKMYVSSIATDGVLYGLSTNKLAYIITEKAETISKLIISELRHGATILTGEGAYTNRPRKMILCAINPNQIGKLKEIVREADEEAFVIVTNTHEVLGFGFKPNTKSNV